ncbi:MAG: hypothetical protein WKG07_04590 [Hymenobacter sp.]
MGSLSTKALVYRSTVELPPGVYGVSQGYYVAVERWPQHHHWQYHIAPQDAAQTFYLEFPAVVRNGQPFRDSTPRLFPALADYACLGELFTYEFGGQDPDGDSLAYDLVTPAQRPRLAHRAQPGGGGRALRRDLGWGPGRSFHSQIPGALALSIGARTGGSRCGPLRRGCSCSGGAARNFGG